MNTEFFKQPITDTKVKVLAFSVIFIIIISLGCWSSAELKKISPLSIETLMVDLTGKNIVFIIAFKDFRDEEYFVPKEVLENAGVEVKTASNQKGTAIGADGGEAEINLLISEIDMADFDAVVFVGGPGCLANLDNKDSYKVAKETIAQNKVLASICVSPIILAKAGALEGKRATVWSSLMDKSAVKTLEANGAIYEDKPVVVDGNIVTGNGPAAARQFGKAIIEVLK